MTISQPGDMGFVSIPGGVGFLIRVGQWLNGDGFKNYEHCFIVLDEYSLIEAMPGGAIVSALSKYPKAKFSSLPLTPQQRTAMVNYARKLQGVKYSFLDYFAIAAHRFHIPVPYLRKYIERTGRMICSQLDDKVHQYVGYKLFADERWNGYVTPGELRVFIKE